MTVTELADRAGMARTIVERIERGEHDPYLLETVALADARTDWQAHTLNQRFIHNGIAGAHRVLMGNGAVSPRALGNPDAVRSRLRVSRPRSSCRMTPPGTALDLDPHVWCQRFANDEGWRRAPVDPEFKARRSPAVVWI